MLEQFVVVPFKAVERILFGFRATFGVSDNLRKQFLSKSNACVEISRTFLITGDCLLYRIIHSLREFCHCVGRNC